MTAIQPPSVASAPGKVLLAGGYLVLDREYTGLVFGLSARIHVVVQAGGEQKEAENALIVVKSPQFRDAEWRYEVTHGEAGAAVNVNQIESPAKSSNPFVQTALIYTLTHLSPTKLPNLLITILADNDYYSSTNTTDATTATTTTSRFRDFGVKLSEANKTGLGSSAALTTAFCAALVNFIQPSLPDVEVDKQKRVLHNLAQAAHCAAQGKVGSGFDVAAAVYGSCLYRRFSPSLLDSLPETTSTNFASKLQSVVGENDLTWDMETRKETGLPNCYALVMCDVDCGSQTVGMVKTVLAWRKANPEDSKALWDKLHAANEGLGKVLQAGDEKVISERFAAIRALIREMGEKSGVPIEPQSQTDLLDALGEVEGVVGGVVPGAGGFDAVVILVRDEKETMGRLNAFLERWSAEKEGRVRLLDVKGEMEGSRIEQAKAYGDWIN